VSPTEVCDPSKVQVFGPAVERDVAVGEPTYFVVDCSDAGPGIRQWRLRYRYLTYVIILGVDLKDNRNDMRSALDLEFSEQLYVVGLLAVVSSAGWAVHI